MESYIILNQQIKKRKILKLVLAEVVGQELHIAIAAEARETIPQFWAPSNTNFRQSLMNISSQK